MFKMIAGMTGPGSGLGTLPDWVPTALAYGAILLLLEWRTWYHCRLYPLWTYFASGGVQLGLFLICLSMTDGLFQDPGAAIGTAFARFIPVLILWKLVLFYFLLRWEPIRGLTRRQSWPRAPKMRGPRGRRYREFREPMPWSRGPFSY